LESGGLYGESSIHFLDLDSFEIKNNHKLPKEVFGEGCDIVTNENG